MGILCQYYFNPENSPLIEVSVSLFSAYEFVKQILAIFDGLSVEENYSECTFSNFVESPFGAYINRISLADWVIFLDLNCFLYCYHIL